MLLSHPFRLLSLFLLAALFWFTACEPTPEPEPLPPVESFQLEPLRAAQLADSIRKMINAELAEGWQLSLWASDSLVVDPVAISIDRQGRIYLTANRRIKHSEFDIRDHRDWMTASISFASVEDRRTFLRTTFAPENSDKNSWFPDLNQDSLVDWKDLMVEPTEVYFVEDQSGDGIADYSQLYLRDFQEEITDVAGALLVWGKEVFLGVGPDLWKISTREDQADKKESISHGYNVHIGFGAHGMSGLIMGPDGRVYWGAGDIGTNVTDKSGRHWNFPNQGTIVRCDPDGSNFEVFCAGLRNTHEFIFDEYGNIITVDNDGDHRGEKERLVYLVDGSDSGWRINWQFGKYTDPDNNSYKVWMDEKMHLPRHEGQAAYFIPPIQNFHAGPAGMKYQPGTALGEDTRGHFFISEFPGTPARARIWAVKMAPDGAGFKMEKERQILQGVLVSGMDFGPDGGLYLADWIEGWGAKDYGRIWKLDVAPHLRHPLRQTTQKLLGSNFSDKSLDSLGLLLGYPDQRVRQEAQFALVEKGEAGADMLMSHVQQSQNQMARIHGLWGWWQLSRRKLERAKELLPFLTDQDPEIRAQTANILGDVGYTEAGPKLLSMMADSSQRVQFFVAQALGKIQHQEAFENLVALLAQNNDEDVYLRHAATLALARLGQEAPLVALATHENEAIRLGAVLALRRMKAAGIQAFLDDENMYIVAEAVRAIHDDYSIPEAMPKLARMLARTDIEGEVMLRRIISANQRLGRGEDWRRLIAYTRRTDQPMAMREEAMACLETWGQPSVLDRVDGRYRGEVKREVNELKEALPTVLTNLLQDRDALMRTAAAKVAGRLELTSLSEEVFQQYQRERKPEAKQAFLISLHQLGHPQTAEIVQAALDSRVRGLRARAVTLLPDLKIPPERIVNLAMGIISRGNPEEQQAALEAIGAIPATYTAAAFEDLMEKYEAGEIHPAVWLEWEEIVEASGSAAIKSRLTAFRQQKVTEGTLGEFYVSQQGGDVQEGRDIFWGHEAAQCTKCHKIGGTGSEVGPSLKGIGSRHEAAYLLESLVNPNAVIAPGYGVVSLIMKDGKTVVGFLESEDDQQIKLTVSDNLTVIAKAEVDQRIDAMSSMLNMGDVLSKREIRDLVAFLGSLK